MTSLLYVTVTAPFGMAEPFVLQELVTLKRLGLELRIAPRSPGRRIVHRMGADVSGNAIREGLFSARTIAAALRYFRRFPRPCSEVIVELARFSTIAQLPKNLAVVPKSLSLAEELAARPVSHIHAAWGTTPATIAYVLHRLTRIPWSMTLHRGDIVEDNMLAVKAASASFVRCISEGGKAMLERAAPGSSRRAIVLHAGTWTGAPVRRRAGPPFSLVAACNLLPVKGLVYLVRACALLRRRGLSGFSCSIYGSGPMLADLRREVRAHALEDVVLLQGPIPHERLLALYRSGQVSAFVLPSINTEDGQHEGIPVALMEAMAAGIPVVSTRTGSIPELVRDGAGLLVEEKDPEGLADAIGRILADERYAEELGARGRAVIAERFDLQDNMRVFRDMVERHALQR